MAATYIYKPGTYKGPVVLVPDSGPRTPPTVTLPDGRQIQGQYLNTNEGRHQFVFPRELYQYRDIQVDYNGQRGNITDGATSYEGSNIGGWQARAKGSLTGGGSGGGVQSGFEPGNVGYGAVPAYMGGSFPSPTFAQFDPIKRARYKYTNPIEYAARIADANRDQIAKNFKQASDIGFAEMEAELKGLQAFVPAASALKRSELAKDLSFNFGQAEQTNVFSRGEIAKTNPFNQAQRTQQLDTALPGVRGQLASQGQRAETFAGGRLTSDIEDRAFEVGVRSRAADIAGGGGFGAQSSVARKTSDLLSAEQRLNLSKYGDSLLGQNINQRAAIELAPTEYARTEIPPTAYSDAGAQIKVQPSVDVGSRVSNTLGEINNRTTLSPESLLSSEVNQRQFQTNLRQRTREFNASGKFSASQFNAGVANQFAQNQFAYDVGYAGAAAGAAQTDINAQTAIQQQEAAQNTFEDNKGATQNANNTQAATSIITAAAPPIIDAVTDFISSESTSGAPSASDTVLATPNLDVPDFSMQAGSPVSSSRVPEFSMEAANPPDAGFVDTSTLRTAPLTTTSRVLDNLDSVANNMRSSPASIGNLKSFVQDTGAQISTTGDDGQTARALDSLTTASDSVLRGAGVSYTPQPGMLQAGFDKSGNPIYSDARLMASQDPMEGQKFADLTVSMADPFTVITEEDAEGMVELGRKASDPLLLRKLDNFHKSGDMKGFLRELQAEFKKSKSVFGKAA